jgi:CubicO group peptidase (beta-lactamase class C family)
MFVLLNFRVNQILITALVLFLNSNISSQDRFIDSIKAKYKIVGLTYAVFKSDTILEIGALGKRRVDGDSPVLISDRFHIGSNTKAITAFLAAKLVEQKKMKWDTKFFDLFPELKTTSKKVYSNITLQDLLCHRAGIQPYRSVNSNRDEYKISGTSVEQKIKFASVILKEEPVRPDSGQTYVYSNAGFTLAASMIEKVSGKSWEELINYYLNEMLQLSFEIGFPNVSNENQPWGHILNNDTIIALPPDFDYQIAVIMRPAGDLNVTLTDYIKFIQLFLRGCTGEDNFLKSKTYKYLLTAMPDYSFGWANKIIDGKLYNYHSGSAATFGCFTKMDRESNIAVIVMENYAYDGALDAIQLIADSLLEKYSDK